MGALTDEVDAARRIAELQEALKREQRRAARYKERQADLVEAVYEAAKDAALAVGRHDPIPRPGRDRRRSPEVAILHLTDLQLGKVSESYSPEVCEERIRLATRKAIKLAEIARADHPVREIHLALGGDLVEGVSVFPGQPFEVSSSTFDQVFRAAALIEQVALTLLESFEAVHVWEVAGNHGRIGRKGDNPRGDNWDRIVGRFVQERLTNQSRLTWHPNDHWFQIIEAGEYRCLLVHGDQIKSFGGNTPAYGILRKATSWAAGAIPEPFSDVLMGHFHTPMTLTLPNGANIRVTGSPESDNEYAREFVAARGKPSQRLTFVSPARGRVTADYVLWLDE